MSHWLVLLFDLFPVQPTQQQQTERSCRLWCLLAISSFNKSPSAFPWAATDYMLRRCLLRADDAVFPEFRQKKNMVSSWWTGSVTELANAWVCAADCWVLSSRAWMRKGWCNAIAGPFCQPRSWCGNTLIQTLCVCVRVCSSCRERTIDGYDWDGFWLSVGEWHHRVAQQLAISVCYELIELFLFLEKMQNLDLVSRLFILFWSTSRRAMKKSTNLFCFLA